MNRDGTCAADVRHISSITSGPPRETNTIASRRRAHSACDRSAGDAPTYGGGPRGTTDPHDDTMTSTGDSGQVQPTDEETEHSSNPPPHADGAATQDAEPTSRHPSGFLATGSGPRRRRSRWIMLSAVIGAAG